MAMDSSALEGRCGMKRIRPIAIILALASSVLLFSTGFATWYTLGALPSPITQNLQLQAYPVIKSDEYVELGEVTYFDYTSKGFVEDVTITDGKVQLGGTPILTRDKGSIEIPVTINPACYSSEYSPFSTAGGMQLEFEITFTPASGKENFLEYCTVTASSSENESPVFTLISTGCQKSSTGVTVIPKINLNYESNKDVPTPGSFTVSIDFNVTETKDKTLEEIFGYLVDTQISIKTIVRDIAV
ncbi:MAG: hypothetical protein IJW50_03605 [Clostridia bacterium]|nr:hypothetical protein [Clostridia bacterium]